MQVIKTEGLDLKWNGNIEGHSNMSNKLLPTSKPMITEKYKSCTRYGWSYKDIHIWPKGGTQPTKYENHITDIII